LHELERVVLSGVDLLECRRVDHVIHTAHRASEAVTVANVANEPAETRVIAELLPRLVLLELVTRVDNDAARVEVRECMRSERFAERARAASDKDRRSSENCDEGLLATPVGGSGQTVPACSGQ